jgi:hypothetical protein
VTAFIPNDDVVEGGIAFKDGDRAFVREQGLEARGQFF